MQKGLPKAQGMYNPENEHDACGIGFVAHIKGQKSHEIVRRGLDVLINMTHRGAESADNVSGDGAGICGSLVYLYPFYCRLRMAIDWTKLDLCPFGWLQN